MSNLNHACVRILIDDKLPRSPKGAGFLIAPNLVITCAHVVAEVLKIAETTTEKPTQTLFLDFPFVEQQPLQAAIVEAWYPVKNQPRMGDIEDLALLRLAENVTTQPFTLIDLPVYLNRAVHLTGFPKTKDEGIYLQGYLRETTGEGRVQIDTEQGRGSVAGGFSGGAVYDMQENGVVGIVVSIDTYGGDVRGYMIPATTLLKAFPQLEAASRLPTINTEPNTMNNHIGGNTTKSNVAGRDLNITHNYYSESLPEKTTPLIGQQKELDKPGLRLWFDYFFPRLHSNITITLGLLPIPTEALDLRDFIREQKAEWIVEIENKTYIPPPAKELARLPASISYKNNSFFSPIQQLIMEIAGLSSGGDSANAQISALSRRSRRVLNLVKRLKQSDEPLIVLGEPGSGKSITLKQVAIELAEENINRIYPTLCIFIPLGRWKPVSNPTIQTVEKLVMDCTPDKIKPILYQLAIAKRLIVIFDGLDEISRILYNEHTAVLNAYAEKYKGQIHTLFSCRITDFSPAFQHHRLVLLPFGYKQIYAYLKRQLGHTALELSGELFSIKKLAYIFDSKQLLLEPHNPFTLWLLCYYIVHEKEKAWLKTRVDLIAFSIKHQFNRKKEEALKQSEDFPEDKQMFSAWGNLAYEITKRNQGTEIEITASLEEIVKFGCLCGVLHKSLEHNPPIVRFSHHRAQEYFTAYHIVYGDNQLELDWEKYMDIPRWQETLVNITQMDCQFAPIGILSENLESISAGELQNLEKLERAREEALVVERIVLSSRILRIIQSDEEREQLTNALYSSSLWLGQYGNPVTHSRLLTVAQELAQEELYPVVNAGLESKITWVKEQAQVVSASLAKTPKALPMVEGIIQSFSDGSILKTFPRRLLQAKQLKSLELAAVSTVVSLLFILQALVLVCSVSFVAEGVSHKTKIEAVSDVLIGVMEVNKFLFGEIKKEKEEIRLMVEHRVNDNKFIVNLYDQLSLFVAGISCFVIYKLISLKEEEWLLMSGAVVILFIPVSLILYLFFICSPLISLSNLIQFLGVSIFFTVIIGYFLAFFLYIIAILVSFIFLMFFSLTILIWTKKITYTKKIFAIMWKSCNLGKTFELISGLIAMSIFSALISIPFKLLDYVFKKIEIHDSDILEYASNTILDFPDISKNIDIALTCLILISVVIILFVLVSYVFNKKVFFLLNLFWVFLPLVIFDSIYLFYTDSTLFFLILNFPAVSTIIDLWLTVIFLASIGLSAISFHPKATETTLVKNLYNSGKTIFSVNIFSYIIIYVGIIAFYYGKKFLIYLGSLSAEIFLYGIIFIFLLIAVVFILAMLYETLLKLDFFIKLTGIDNNHSGDNFHNSSPEFQIYYLNNIINKKLKHSSLQDYEEELIKLEDNIKDQEVLDIYWAKRAEIQALIKQSRME